MCLLNYSFFLFLFLPPVVSRVYDLDGLAYYNDTFSHMIIIMSDREEQREAAKS